ncbi:unnamed protein product [Rotaria socialis]|uniref:F-box domain-containing protein n=2 Tax=Rotaria socialis TaxID=392032 RepID=A0A818GXD7_9BILA|nr:unnamed protein product [Rotaria socialis]CAF3670512.1 unnamed protein product [Rotaria socialis]
MTIPVVDMILPWNDQVFDNYLCCVPNSEKLVIYRSIFISKADEFLLEYDWSASKIALYLLSARRFYFYFQIIQIEEKFVNIDINPSTKFCQAFTIQMNQIFTAQSHIMNTHKSQLEDLPNELLSEILRNLDARDVFRAFYQVNSRFNELIQSFQHLQLTFHMNSNNFLKTNDEIFSFYVYTLIISPWINFNLQNFPRVRRLRLDNPLPKVLEQLQPNIMPHLEYLSVFYTYNMYEMVILHENVFSNRFVNLKSCELYEKQTLITIPHWTQSPSLQVLKTEYIDSTIFKIILGACPNLYFFKFYLYPTNGMTTDIPLHNNLKHMIIELQDVDWYYDDNTINAFLKSVPKLEQLEIHRRFYSQHMRENIKDYDWFSLIIKHRLPILRRFRFYFHLSKEEKLIGCIDENIQIQIERNFHDVHKGLYQAQIFIDRE